MKKAEFEFLELIRHPWKLFGYSYLYVLALLGGLGFYYISQLTIVGKNNIMPAVPPDSAILVQDIPMQPASAVLPVDVNKAGISTTLLVARGREIFRANCVGCHGETGSGDGAAGATLNPPPRNFRKSDGWVNGTKVSQIYKTLQEGIFRSGMSAFNYVPPEDRFALAHYIRTLIPVPEMDAPDDMASLESTYQLSKGSTTAAQIPVRVAMKHVIEESKGNMEHLQAVIKSVHASPSKGAVLFRSCVANETKAVIFFAAQKGQNAESLERIVARDPIGSGFKASVVLLSKEDWKSLIDFATAL